MEDFCPSVCWVLRRYWGCDVFPNFAGRLCLSRQLRRDLAVSLQHCLSEGLTSSYQVMMTATMLVIYSVRTCKNTIPFGSPHHPQPHSSSSCQFSPEIAWTCNTKHIRPYFLCESPTPTWRMWPHYAGLLLVHSKHKDLRRFTSQALIWLTYSRTPVHCKNLPCFARFQSVISTFRAKLQQVARDVSCTTAAREVAEMQLQRQRTWTKVPW